MLGCDLHRAFVPQSTGEKGKKDGTKRLFGVSRACQFASIISSFFVLSSPRNRAGKSSSTSRLISPSCSSSSSSVGVLLCDSLAGLWNNSLGLISDAGHMLFDSSALVIGLIASYMTQWPSSPTYSFGFKRVEVLSGLVNGVFLVFVGFSVAMESLERLQNPPEVGDNQLMATSVGGLLVNLIGLVFFHDVSHAGHDHGHDHDHSHGHSHGHEHVEMIMNGMRGRTITCTVCFCMCWRIRWDRSA